MTLSSAPPRPAPEAAGHAFDNRELATTRAEVDALNAGFYGDIRYPWPPAAFERLADARFWADALDLDTGRRGRPVLPEGGRVWVAGCGTNQAVITALMFPRARVLGTDVSDGSLEVARENARHLALGNLELRRESLYEAPYRGEFDYVVCTGVIHHTADPGGALARLAAALRPAGVMQLMVYNRYHRTRHVSLQKAVRTLLGSRAYAYREELALARRFVEHYAGPGPMARWLAGFRGVPEAHLADSLVQPVEQGYTVESLEALAAGAGLELLAPFPNPYDAAGDNLHWEMEMGDAELQRAYDALPDARRWQLTNLLLQEAAPMLWFHLQRADSPVPRPTTRELCDGFLSTRFAPARTTRRTWLADPAQGGYRPFPREISFPARRPEEEAQGVLDALDPAAPMRATLERLGMDTACLRAVNRLRLLLASSAYPYLRAV